MKSHARKTTLAAAILLGGSVLTGPSLAEQSKEIGNATTFAKNGKSYSVRHVFQSSCRTENLLAICFEFKHLQKFYRESNVRLVDSGQDWQKVEYRTDYAICSSIDVYRKTLIRQQGKVSFTLLSSQASGLGMPGMTASSGTYTVTDSGKIRTLTYAQSVTLDREISELDWSLIKSKTKAFFADFEKYVRLQGQAPSQQKIVPPDEKTKHPAMKSEPSSPHLTPQERAQK